METTYHQFRFRLHQKTWRLLYVLSHTDRFVTGQSGLIPSFSDFKTLIQFAKLENLELFQFEKKLPTYAKVDLDGLELWLQNPQASSIHCSKFLTIWNLFWDVSNSLNLDFDPDHTETNVVYDKFFFGSNLPSVTPKGKSYQPIWSDEELKLITSVLSSGFVMFCKHIQPISPRLLK